MDRETRMTLTKPFPFGSHKWRVLNTSKNKDKATWYVYVDARDVAQRLDSTGLDWSDEYEIITMDDKLCVVQCKLTIGNSTRTDVGSDSRQINDTEGNYIKGAFSDALKRAAVKFGIGRYLYGMTSFYVPIDEFKRFTPEALTKIKAHLTNELAKVGAEGSADDLRNEDEEVTEPTLQELAGKTTQSNAVTPVTPTNGNGNGHKPESAKVLPFDRASGVDTHFNAIEWAMGQGVYNARQHAENSYKKLSAELSYVGRTATKEQTDALLWAWVEKVRNKAAEMEQAAQSADNPLDDDTSLHDEFDRLGQEIYTDQWEQVRHQNVERISGGDIGDYKKLDEESIKKLISGLKKLKRQRVAA